MASRAIVGVAAAASVLYCLNEKLKDHECQKEAIEQEQQEKDRLEKYLCEEAERHRRCENVAAAPDGLHNRGLFHARIYNAVDNEQERVLLHIRDVAALQYAESGRTMAMHFPLLSNGTANTPAEIMLGAALSLGNSQCVSCISPFLRNDAGLAMAKLSLRSINLIRSIFLNQTKRPLHPSIRNFPAKDFESEIQMLLVCTAYRDTPEDEPFVRLFQHKGGMWQADKFRALQLLAMDMGLYLVQKEFYTEKTGNGMHLFRLKLKKVKTGIDSINAMPVTSLATGEWYVVSNFLASFQFPSGDEGEELEIVGQGVGIRRPNAAVLVHVAASLLAARTFMEAMNRLESAASPDGISLEHIAVISGYEGDLLADMRDESSGMVEHNKDKIVSVMETKLRAEIPPPGLDLFDDGCHLPNLALEREISIFIENYIELLRWVTCVVPRLEGRPPSAWVAPSSVDDVARSSMFVIPPRGTRRIRRFFELDERNRLMRSRKLSHPPMYATACSLGMIWILLHWIVIACVKRFPIQDMSIAVLHFISILLTAWSLSSGVGYLKGPLLVETDEKGLSLIWATAANLTETLLRKYSEWRGHPNAFETRLAFLQKVCRDQYEMWRYRLALRDYFRALHGKKIGYSYCEILLKDLGCDKSTGELPGSIDDAEMLLHLEVVDDEESTREKIHPIESFFSEVFLDVASLLQAFPVGKRVRVAEEYLNDNETVRLSEPGGAEVEESDTFQSYRIGSVVLSMGDEVIVQFDGETIPRLIPSEWCEELAEPIALENGAKSHKPVDDEASLTSEVDTRESEEEVLADNAGLPKTGGNEATTFEKARTIEEALQAGGWEFVREKRHIIYRRRVKLDDRVGTQYFSTAKTPSDNRSAKNALSGINRRNAESAASKPDSDTHTPDRRREPSQGTLQHSWCVSCKSRHPLQSFSKSQLKRDIKVRRCKLCVSSS